MKLLQLDLTAFGSLRDVSLPLASDGPCLHVIYGPNEAGKSTALRGLAGLFYGIPALARDAHSIDPQQLRVGAQLCDARGRSLYVVRRKGLKDTLRDAEFQPLPAAESSWITAGVQESTFNTLFGLSFESLQQGNEELLGAAGDLGQSLFSAAAGGGRLRSVLEDLEKTASELFKPRGRNQHLNAALLQLEELKKQSRDAMVKSSTLTEQQAGIELAESQSAELLAQILALRAERERLERARRVLPLITRQTALREELALLGEVVRLPPEAASERRKSEVDRREAQLRFEHAQAEVQRLLREREALAQAVQPGMGELRASDVEQLQDRLAGYRRSVRALPTRRAALAHARAEVERALAPLQLQAAGAEDIEKLRLPKRLEARVREQLRAGERVRTRLAELGKIVAEQRDQLERLRQKLWRLWSPDELTAAAPLLARCALPSVEQCEVAHSALAEHTQGLRLLEGKLDDGRARLEHNLHAREALALSGVPPSEAELSMRRAQREEAWSELRTLLIETPEDPRRVALLDRAVALTQLLDSLHERMRREADRVAQAASLQLEQTALERNLEVLQAKRSELQAQLAAHEARWQAPFLAAGVPVRTPREAGNVLAAQRALEQQCEQVERELARSERELKDATLEERSSRHAWRELAAELGLPEGTSAAELEALLEARAELVLRHDATQSLARECASLQREVEEFAAHTAQLAAAHLPALARLQPEAAAEKLIAAHRQTHTALTQLTQLDATLRSRRETGQEAEQELARAERRLASFMQAAGVTDPSQLEAAEERSARAHELDGALCQLDAELASASDGQDPEQIAAEARGTLDEVRARLLEVDERLDALDTERHRVTQQLGSLRGGLSRLYESHAASDAAVSAAAQLEEVRALCQRYVRARLATSVLKREIAQYRERHRAPLLRIATDLFAQLTLGAYRRLDVDIDERDQPVLVCVRQDDAHLSVAALSTGTRDQLYLALRLASIQHLSTERELMPLILDDVLVHFDDERARAALVALAEFCSVTQVLFFTHHERLCELARTALPQERVRIHRLPALRVLRPQVLHSV